MAIKKCKYCSNLFETPTSGKYCSAICSVESRIKENTKSIYEGSPCSEFTGTTKASHMGHGYIWFNGGNRLVHRVSFEHYHGPIPEDRNTIRHLCNNPKCVNPKHLACGTHQDNMDDKVKAGRQSRQPGDSHPGVKWTDAQCQKAIYLYESGKKMNDISKMLGVEYSTIHAVCKGLQRKHLIRKGS